MRRDLVRVEPITSSFLSCEKDIETILRKLFIESRPYSDVLKRLLVIQNSDCLDNDCEEYKKKIDEMTLPRLVEEGYVILTPKVQVDEFAEEKSRIAIAIDNFTANLKNPEFRDCLVHFTILCPVDEWDLKNYRLRPFKILGYIDGLLNKSKLSGIGELNFVGASETNFTSTTSAHVLTYKAIHGSDDQIPVEEDINE